MVSRSLSVEISRPVEQVFDYVTDRANLHEWFSGVIAAEQQGTNQVGTKARIRVRFMGVTMESVSEVTAYEPNHRFAIRGADPFPYEETEIFTPVDGGTRVEYHADYDLRGLYRLAAPLVLWMAGRQITASYARLKDLLEARQGQAT